MATVFNYIFGFCFFISFIFRICGNNTNHEIDQTAFVYLLLALFFYIIPQAKSLKIFHLLEFESKLNETNQILDQTKQDLDDTKAEYRALFNTVISTITVNNQLKQNFFITSGEKEAEQLITNQGITGETRQKIEEEVENWLRESENDYNWALAKLRMTLEKELRLLIKKKNEFSLDSSQKKYVSLGSLFRMYSREYQKQNLTSSFNYINSVCNQAIHGVRVPDKYAEEVLILGVDLIKDIKESSQL